MEFLIDRQRAEAAESGERAHHDKGAAELALELATETGEEIRQEIAKLCTAAV